MFLGGGNGMKMYLIYLSEFIVSEKRKGPIIFVT
jgi:hypothetical protein